jgi:hypothetical protein
LERLKEIVPLGADASRHTTLGLLTKAKRFIKVIYFILFYLFWFIYGVEPLLLILKFTFCIKNYLLQKIVLHFSLGIILNERNITKINCPTNDSKALILKEKYDSSFANVRINILNNL